LKRRLSAGKRSLYGAMVIAMALAAAISPSSWACGACVEDAIAATYDHATIRAAIAKRQQVVFVSIEGGDPARVVRVLGAAARKVRGVQAGTLRTAVSAPGIFVRARGGRVSRHRGFRVWQTRRRPARAPDGDSDHAGRIADGGAVSARDAGADRSRSRACSGGRKLWG
jgi:hypothetical protein